MQREQGYSNFIYEYFIRCFQFQRYSYGQILPSIDFFCKKFSVSDRTIKAALKQLSDEGYISIQKGKVARVIFQQSEEQSNKYIRCFYSERWIAFLDLSQVTETTFQPLLIEGFHLLDDYDYKILSGFAEQADPSNLIHFYCYILLKLKNSLIMNLFWECLSFLGFPYITNWNIELYDLSSSKKRLKQIIAYGRLQQWDQLHDELLVFYKEIINMLTASIEQYILPVPADQQISFTWSIYHGRPQICHKLGTRIMYEIYLGNYRDKGFLPSYDKMAEVYGVSLNTVRRTVCLLTQVGVAQTINGKGTRIFSLGETISQPDFTIAAIRRHLALFYRAFELLFYICEDITCDFLSFLSEEEKSSLTNQLKGYLDQEKYELTPWCILIGAAEKASMQGSREICAKIFGLSLWGYPLKASYGKSSVIEHSTIRLTEALIQYLPDNNIVQCALAFKKFVSDSILAIEKYLIYFGVEQNDLHMPLSVHSFYHCKNVDVNNDSLHS